MKLLKASKMIILLFIIVLSPLLLNSQSNTLFEIPDEVSIYTLDNGLEVMMIEKPSLPMVGINTLVKVGSAFEDFATSGMSHMLEHLLFNGTETMTQKELYDSTDFIGGYNNAHTGEYFTNFMMVTPADNIVEGMKIQSAMLFNSIIPEEKFEKEKGIVLEEIAKSLSRSSEQIERNITSIIYEGHALSLPTLGTYSTIENMKRDDVYNFYKNYYIPNNMRITVIGNFKSDEMLENIETLYGKVQPGRVKEIKAGIGSGFSNTLKDNTHKAFHRFYGGDNYQLQLFFEIESRYTTEFASLLELAFDKKKEEIKSRLSEAYPEQIEEIEFSTRESPVINHFQVTLIMKSDDNLSQIRKSLLELLYSIKPDLAYETVLNESVKSRTRFLQNTEKPHMFGIYNASILGEKGIEGILASYSGNEILNAYSFLDEYQLPDEYITIVQNPDRNSGASSLSKAGGIEVYEDINNGPVLISKQTGPGGLLAVHFLIKNKAELENKFGKDAAQTWHEAFGERMESPGIQKISSNFGFEFTVNDNPFIPMDNIYLNPEFGYIRVEGLSDSVEAAIGFLLEQMLDFVPTEEEFSLSSGKMKAPSMMGHGNMAQKLFSSKVNSVLYEDERFPTSEAELNYQNLVDFGREYFHPSNMIVSVVSPEKNGRIKEYFSEFTKPGRNTENDTGYMKQFKELNSPQKIEMEGGGEQSYLYFGFQKTISKEEKPALKVLSLILSDNIIFDIRERQGLAYSMSAGIDVKKDKAMFHIKMSTRPENTEKIIPQFPDYFTTGFKDKITDQIVKKSVNMYLGKMMFRRLSSINQAYYLGYSKYFYDDVSHDSGSLDKLKSVSVDDIKDIIDKYMIVENPVEIYVK